MDHAAVGRDDQLVGRGGVEVGEHGLRGRDPRLEAREAVDEVRIVVHEDALLGDAVQPVAGAAMGGDDHPQPHGEALLVGPARGRGEGCAGRTVGERGSHFGEIDPGEHALARVAHPAHRGHGVPLVGRRVRGRLQPDGPLDAVVVPGRAGRRAPAPPGERARGRLHL